MNSFRTSPLACLVLALGTIVVVPALTGAQSGAAPGNARQIVQESQKRGTSTSQRYEGLLETFDGSRKASEKRWTYARLGSHGQSKVVIRFTAPAEVRDVALLIVNRPDRASDQWMWTPALERDRRIALQDRSTRFFGTDFSFEDLEERDVDQYEYTLLGEEVIDGAMSWKIQSTPRESRASQYTRTIAWIRKDNYAWARADLYVNDQVVRRQKFSDIQNIQGVWTARETTMTDYRRNGTTRLVLDKIEYNVPLRDDAFTLQGLRRQ